MNKERVFCDSRGEKVNVGDNVMIYFGYNNLLPGVVKEIKGMGAKVLVDAWPSHPNPEYRYSLSKWKRGDCMVKVPDPERPYPEEVYKLIDEIISEKNNIDNSFEVRTAMGQLYKFWQMKKPLRLVTS